MDVMVYWSKDGEGKGAIDHYSSPYSGGWSGYRVEFWRYRNYRPADDDEETEMEDEDAPVIWCVRIVDPSTSVSEHKKRREGEWDVEAESRSEWKDLAGLGRVASGFDEYEAWLEENVDAIQVNGYPWWQSERVSEAARIADGLDALIGQEEVGS